MTDAPLILVVDDIEDNRYALTRRLKREGYERVIEATNGREALDKLESENVDLVLLDIMMPEIDGFEVLRRMRADTAAAPCRRHHHLGLRGAGEHRQGGRARRRGLHSQAVQSDPAQGPHRRLAHPQATARP